MSDDVVNQLGREVVHLRHFLSAQSEFEAVECGEGDLIVAAFFDLSGIADGVEERQRARDRDLSDPVQRKRQKFEFVECTFVSSQFSPNPLE